MLSDGLRLLEVGFPWLSVLEAVDRKFFLSSQSFAVPNPSDEDNSSKKYRSEFRILAARLVEEVSWTALPLNVAMFWTGKFVVFSFCKGSFRNLHYNRSFANTDFGLGSILGLRFHTA